MFPFIKNRVVWENDQGALSNAQLHIAKTACLDYSYIMGKRIFILLRLLQNFSFARETAENCMFRSLQGEKLHSRGKTNRVLQAALFYAVFLAAALPLWSQAGQADLNRNNEPFSFVGMSLNEVFRRFGPPQTVHAARGDETWQDDVVFAYNEWDFYIYQNRVWQIAVKSLYEMKLGDSRGVALLVLGETAQEGSDYIIYSFPGGAWPLSIRVNFDMGRISSIFIYRTDY